MEELLSLKWNNHRTSFIHQLSQLRKKSTYTDVTLACDGKLYNVHKVVLSACSDYFSHIFDNISCPNPVIVLKDMSASHLESLLDYMYLGEVNVRQVDLASLIQAAECLKLKGLAIPENDTPEKSDSKKRSSESPSSVRKKPRRTTPKVTPTSDDNFDEPPTSTPPSMKTEDIVTIKEEPPTSDIKECTETWDFMVEPDIDPIDFDQNDQPTEDLNLYNEMTSPFETDNFDEGEETNTEMPPNYDQASQPSSSNAHRRTEFQNERLKMRCKIIGLKEIGWTHRQIADHLGIALTTVTRWVSREQKGEDIETRKAPAKARKTTAEQDQQLLEYFENNPFSNAVEAKQELQLPICAETVRRRLHSVGIRHRTPSQK